LVHLGFSDRVKLLLQKALDPTKWPIGDSGQGPGGLRYLTDGQGNLVAIVTTSVNPNDTAPIGPGSAEAAAEVDPILRALGHQIPYTATKKTNVVFKALIGRITGTNNIATLESPAGTDYQVPVSKTFFGTHADFSAIHTGALYFAIGYGDDGVADGTTDPTTPIWVIGTNNASGSKSPYSVQVSTAAVDHPPIGEFDIYCEIPAGKFPFFEAETDNTNKEIMLYGFEADA